MDMQGLNGLVIAELIYGHGEAIRILSEPVRAKWGWNIMRGTSASK